MRAALAALATLCLACADGATDPDLDPPSLELVKPDQRLPAINSHVYGSFAVAAGGGVIRSGPANFPGHPPAGPGTCEDGRWINAQGKSTAGTLEKPHPHCFSPNAAIEIVLEPISACYDGAQDPPVSDDPKAPVPVDPCPKRLAFKDRSVITLWWGNDPFGKPMTIQSVDFFDNTNATDFTSGGGWPMVGYAIDASTLGGANKRVGILTINTKQYDVLGQALMQPNDSPGCTMGEGQPEYESPCLNKVVTAVYNPLPPEQGGLGPVDQQVEGFLWVTPAASTYNYTD